MRLLICKDKDQNTLLETRVLQETENIKYEIIEDVPEIKEKDGYVGRYALDQDGNVVIVYDEKPKTQLDIIQEQLEKLMTTTDATHTDGLINMDMIMGIDDKIQ